MYKAKPFRAEKPCSICGTVKPNDLRYFYKRSSASDGTTSECRDCFKLRGKGYRERNLEKRAEYRKRYAADHPTYFIEKSRVRHIRDKYGLTVDEYEQRWIEQDRRCGLCGEFTERPHLDHDPASGQLREFLCMNCNHGLGKFKDDPARLRAAADYIERHAKANRVLRKGKKKGR